MRILSLRFKNINSLKGEWFIDFEDTAFIDSNLFVITGPTGAGKTTLLDAICLALYHQTPRLSSINSSQNELMTRHTAECFSEVTFSTNGQRYRSRWDQHRAGRLASGALQNPRVELCEANSGKIIANKIQDKLTAVSEITGLNFERFTRSALLAQGSFTAFLKADKRKKAELLEEMTGTEIYGLISIRAFQRMRDEENKLKELQAAITGLPFLEEDQRQALDKEKKTLSEDLKNFKENKKKLDEIALWYKEIDKINHSLKQNDQKWQLIQQEWTANKPLFDKVVKAQPALTLKPLYDQQQQTISKLKKNDLEINTIKKQLKQLEVSIGECGDKLANEEKNFKEFTLNKEQQETLIRTQIIPIDKQIENNQAQYLEAEKEFLSLKQSLQQREQKLHQRIKNKKSNDSQLTQLEQWLQKNPHLNLLKERLPLLQQLFNDGRKLHKEQSVIKGKLQNETNRLDDVIIAHGEKLLLKEKLKENLKEQRSLLRSKDRQLQKILGQEKEDELEKKFQFLRARQPFVNQLTGIASRVRELKEASQKAQQSLKESRRKIVLTEEKITELIKEENDARVILEQAKELLDKEKIIQHLRQIRTELQEGDNCPVCGATEHQTHSIEDQQANDSLQANVNKAEKRSQFIRDQLLKFQQELIDFKASLSNTAIRLQQLEKDFVKETDRWQECCHSLELELDYNNSLAILDFEVSFTSSYETLKNNMLRITSLSRETRKLKENCQSTDKQLEQLEHEIKICREKKRSLEKIVATLTKNESQLLKKATVINQKIETLRTELNITQTLNKSQFTDLERQAETLSANKTTCRKLQEQSKILAVQINNEQKSLHEEKQRSENFATRLKQFKDGNQQLLDKRRNLFGDATVTAVTTKLKADEDLHKAKISQLQAELQKNKAEQANNSGRLQKLQETVAADKKNLAELQEQFNAQLAASPFTSTDEFLNSLMPAEELTTALKKKKELETRQIQVSTRLKDDRQKLQNEQDKKLSDQSADEINEQVLQIQKDLDDRQQRFNAIHFKLLENENLLKLKKQKLQEIEKQENILQVWTQLANLIGSRDGQAFRNYAQGLTLDHLIFLANKHLQKLHGRYSLKRQDFTSLDLDVIDTYQADSVRPVETLSGGESFLVSLSLALALSDLASHKVSIDSLFIDEGFGTLDAETLDTALDALDHLNASGKMIGVISHIEALKERISLSISVKTDAGLGISRLDDQYAVKKAQKIAL